MKKKRYFKEKGLIKESAKMGNHSVMQSFRKNTEQMIYQKQITDNFRKTLDRTNVWKNDVAIYKLKGAGSIPIKDFLRDAHSPTLFPGHLPKRTVRDAKTFDKLEYSVADSVFLEGDKEQSVMQS